MYIHTYIVCVGTDAHTAVIDIISECENACMPCVTDDINTEAGNNGWLILAYYSLQKMGKSLDYLSMANLKNCTIKCVANVAVIVRILFVQISDGNGSLNCFVECSDLWTVLCQWV